MARDKNEPRPQPTLDIAIDEETTVLFTILMSGAADAFVYGLDDQAAALTSARSRTWFNKQLVILEELEDRFEKMQEEIDNYNKLLARVRYLQDKFKDILDFSKGI